MLIRLVDAAVMWCIVPQVAVQSLWNMRLAVLVKPEHEGRVNHVSTASVRTGLGNTLGGLTPARCHGTLGARTDNNKKKMCS